jgi:hypothetical protein
VAVKALIASDKARGFRTRLIALDSASDMKKGIGAEVTDPTSARQNKAAIDAIYTALTPDYLMILGAVAVVPHQDLNNPMYGADDPDEYAYGDVPYACEAPYSQQPEKFIGPTRVVGRLPDLTGSTDPLILSAYSKPRRTGSPSGRRTTLTTLLLVQTCGRDPRR